MISLLLGVSNDKVNDIAYDQRLDFCQLHVVRLLEKHPAVGASHQKSTILGEHDIHLCWLSGERALIVESLDENRSVVLPKQAIHK